MAFDISKMQNVSVGPIELFIYTTTDTLAAGSTTYFNNTDCPWLDAGSMIIVAHNTNAKMSVIRISAIDASSSTWTSVVAS